MPQINELRRCDVHSLGRLAAPLAIFDRLRIRSPPLPPPSLPSCFAPRGGRTIPPATRVHTAVCCHVDSRRAGRRRASAETKTLLLRLLFFLTRCTRLVTAEAVYTDELLNSKPRRSSNYKYSGVQRVLSSQTPSTRPMSAMPTLASQTRRVRSSDHAQQLAMNSSYSNLASVEERGAVQQPSSKAADEQTTPPPPPQGVRSSSSSLAANNPRSPDDASPATTPRQRLRSMRVASQCVYPYIRIPALRASAAPAAACLRQDVQARRESDGQQEICVD